MALSEYGVWDLGRRFNRVFGMMEGLSQLAGGLILKYSK